MEAHRGQVKDEFTEGGLMRTRANAETAMMMTTMRGIPNEEAEKD